MTTSEAQSMPRVAGYKACLRMNKVQARCYLCWGPNQGLLLCTSNYQLPLCPRCLHQHGWDAGPKAIAVDIPPNIVEQPNAKYKSAQPSSPFSDIGDIEFR